MSWWDPVYDFDRLEIEWTNSLTPWLDYIDNKTEEELSTEVVFVGYDGTNGPPHQKILPCN